MILLDTNIISEIMKMSPDLNVKTWLEQQDTSQLFISTITIAEISYGINALTEGNRQRLLQEAFHNVINETFKYRTLTFHLSAAEQYGKIMSHKKRIGKPMSVLDGQIAAIASVENKILATRNIRDFADCGLELMNPFHNK